MVGNSEEKCSGEGHMTKRSGSRGQLAPPKARFDAGPRLIIWPRLVPGRRGPLRVRPKHIIYPSSPRKGIFDLLSILGFSLSSFPFLLVGCRCGYGLLSGDVCSTSLPLLRRKRRLTGSLRESAIFRNCSLCRFGAAPYLVRTSVKGAPWRAEETSARPRRRRRT